MKTPALIITLALALAAHTPDAQAQAAKTALQAAGKLFRGKGGMAAVTLAGIGGAVALDRHLAAGETAYSLQFDLNNDASSIYWADVFSKPDVFPVLQVAGIGNYLVPDIARNYAGGKLNWTFKIPQIPAGRDISVVIYDDDSSSNHIWQNILKTRWAVTVTGEVPLQLTAGIPIRGAASGQLQLVTQPITIDAAEQLSVYSISTPRIYFGGDWDSIGDLLDGSRRVVGHVKLSLLRNK